MKGANVMKSRLGLSRIFSLFLSLALVSMYVIPVSAAQYTQDSDTAWYDSISDMLAAGEYEEGVVIAGIDMSKARNADDPGSALETKKLRTAAEEIISVDPEDALTEEEFRSWLKEHKDGLDGDSEGICITAVRRSDMTTARILKLLASDDSVVFAEPNYIISTETVEDDATLSSAERASGVSDAGAGDRALDEGKDNMTAAGSAAPDARDVTALQWSSSKDSTFRSFDALENASINVPGWPDGSNMDHEIIVAVMDYAVDFSNPDLADRAYTFTSALQEKLGCDEHGFNATWESKDGKLTYNESDDHGTHVAGIIGASWDGKGINGVGSDIRIVSVQNMNEDGLSSLINGLRGMSFIKEARESGVDIRVINNSWQILQNSKAFDAAVTELGKCGVLTIFASGNDHQDISKIQHIQSTIVNNPYAVITASADCSGNLADTSNYGSGAVTLAAPGVDILSTIIADNYIPAMANENSYYEDFENDSADLRIYQIDPETGEEVSGTEGVIVRAEDAMGFEGKKVIRVTVDPAHAGDRYGDPVYSIRFDFGGADGLASDKATEYFGFAFGGIDEVEICDCSGYSGWFFNPYNHKNSWNIFNAPLGEMTIDPEKPLSITVTVDVGAAGEVYFDTIGIGSEKHPYGIKSGTSMAGPAVTGAAAVLASRHYDELAAGDGDSVIKLAGYVRSSVRPMPALSDKVSTGGIIDLSIDTYDTGSSDQTNPDITDVSVSGREVKLTGTGFGSSGGTVEIRKYVSGKDPDVLASEVSGWSNESAELTLGEDFDGIIEAELTAANGKKDTIIKYISKSRDLFETDHHIDSDVGDVFAFDPPDGADPVSVRMGDSESSGITAALSGRIYYMPAVSEVEEEPAYRSLYCYDPGADSWTSCPSYPAWITFVSAAAYDGKLYVKGTPTEVEESGNIPYYDNVIELEESGEPVIWSYTPGDTSWHKCSVTDVHGQHTLFSTDAGLMLAGSVHIKGDPEDEYDYGYTSNEIRGYDPENGAGDITDEMPDMLANPIVTYAFGHVCMCDNTGTLLYVMGSDLTAANSAEVEMPPGYGMDEFAIADTNSTMFSLAGDRNRLVLIWTDIKTGTADTYILKEGEKSFSPYEKRVSDAALFGPSSVIADGRLYVLASSVYEPDKRLFRSTLLKDSDPGDSSSKTSIAGAKVTLSKKSFTYNGKVRKPSIKTIGGRALKAGTDYTVKWSNSKSKNVGSYTVTIKGKGKYTGTTKTTYKINPKGTSLKKPRRAKKAIIVIWKRQTAKMSKSHITGYQIQLATDKKFTKNRKTVTVKRYKKVSKKVRKLRGGRKYYIRIRTYKTVKGVKYYSPWSKTKSATTKK